MLLCMNLADMTTTEESKWEVDQYVICIRANFFGVYGINGF